MIKSINIKKKFASLNYIFNKLKIKRLFQKQKQLLQQHHIFLLNIIESR